jgi:uncharacterized damage-inducible protein DinB
MKPLLQQYAAYNVWANQKIFDCISKLSDEQINKEIASSFPSIYKTVLHMWVAEDVWWQRLKLTEHIVIAAESFSGPFSELVQKLAQQSAEWLQWVNGATETQLSHVFAYQNTKKELFKQPVYEMVLHLFNHGTYHRGQLVTMLRQLGIDKIPSTDFTSFCRRKES